MNLIKRTLLVGFGNLDRADDGVAFHVVNALRHRLGQAALDENSTGLDELGNMVDSVFIGQLIPEMIDLLDGYDRIIFVDAHVDPTLDELYCETVSPEEAGLTFTHHMSPATLLAFYKALRSRDLEGHLISILGRNFDFNHSLSMETQSFIEPAVDLILYLNGK
jgi:hydrogenase maturation protease